MFAKPQAEHQWLDQLIGNWTIEQKCDMPDGTSTTTRGKMLARSLGGLWLVCESSGESSEGDSWECIMTLGFDPKRKKYVGSFVASIMAQQWLYEGVTDENRKRLPLHSSGQNSKAPAHRSTETRLKSSTVISGYLTPKFWAMMATGPLS